MWLKWNNGGLFSMTDETPELIDAYYFGDRPHIRDRRIPVATLATAARVNGYDAAALAHHFTLTEAEAQAALAYYAEHKAEIDVQQAEEADRFAAAAAEAADQDAPTDAGDDSE